MEKLREEVEKWRCNYQQLQISTAKEKEEALGAAIDENERRFDRALEQIRTLYSDLDISEVGFCKEVVDSWLV